MLCVKMVQLFQANKEKAVEVAVKVIADVYQGKPKNPAFPNYTSGFISNHKSKVPVSLSEKEKANIAKYHAAMAAGSATGGDVAGAASASQGDDNLPF